MTPRTLLLLLALLPACSPDSAGPVDESPIDDIRAVHISRGGVPLDTLQRTGSLGTIGFELMIEGRDGTLRPVTTGRPSWGSTHPAVLDEVYRDGAEAHFSRNQNGRARVIAELGAYRDTVTVEVLQLPAGIRIYSDTLVTLADGARDISGAPTAYHTMRFGATRVDSNGFTVSSKARIDYEPLGAAPFDLFPGANGDTISIAGRHAGTGGMIVRFAGNVDTLPVQVAPSYRVIRLSETSSGAPRPLPATVSVPRGAAVIFRNETSFGVSFGEEQREALLWRVGPVAPGYTEAQVFNTPGTFLIRWFGATTTIVVTP